MILVVTSHDEATISNHKVCVPFIASVTVNLTAAKAVRANIIGALKSFKDVDVFFVGHGKPHSFVGNDSQDAVLISDRKFFAERKSFAIACHTGSDLGQHVSQAGGIWCGYEGAINCLPSDDDVIKAFRDIVEHAMQNFCKICDEQSGHVFVDSFSKLIDSVEQGFDTIGLSSMEPYVALNHLRDRLRIWISGASSFICSPDATFPSSLF